VKRRVVIYCPDRHIQYHGRTPDEVGVGGGVTARVRMARALARRGHDVHMVVNCPRAEVFDGVHYWPLDGGGPTDGDVLVANTSGGALDLTPAIDLAPGFGLRVTWIQGTPLPRGFADFASDWVYAVSNFISAHIQRAWGVDARRIFVAYNAFEATDFAAAEAEGIVRDPFALIYAGHPSKGLQAAIDLLRVLREGDPRYTLRVFGGNRLWGQKEDPLPTAPGMVYGGLIGQRRMVRELLASQTAIQLQRREEPGSLLLLEALRAGCLLIGSPVGCYPEIVVHGRDGALIHGDPESTETIRHAADALRGFTGDEAWMQALRERPRQVPWSSDRMAEVWAQQWGSALGDRTGDPSRTAYCTRCGSEALPLADGVHCLTCSHYSPSWPATAVASLGGAAA
jgi:glycosyltransferase involved in cell wall biosynthesis